MNNISSLASRMTPSFSPRHSSLAAAPVATSSTHGARREPPRDDGALPAYGNPNHLANPASHYFPSVTRDDRARMAQKRTHQAAPPRAPHSDQLAHRDAALPPIPTEYQQQQHQQQQQQQQPYPSQPPAQRRRREHEWNPAAEPADERDDQASDTEMELDHAPLRLGAGGEDQEPAKKRSRTLTTAHQTAVLTALLAKTRFPSTETREEVGLEIGMSARRVQIWFQNRRQSQKRARERDGPDPSSTPPAHAGGHPYAVSQASAHDYLSNDPYRHSHRFSTHSNGTGLSRQTSTDSLASVASFASAKTSQSTHHHRQSEHSPQWSAPPLPREHESHRAPAWAAGNVFPPPPAATAHRVYAFASRDPHADARQQHHREQSEGRRVSAHAPHEVRLPSLSSVVGSALPQSAPRVEFPSARELSPPLFAYQPPPPLSTSQSFHSDRTAHREPPLPAAASAVSSPSSSATTLPRFDADEFARLRISGTSASSVALRDQHSGNTHRHGRTASTASAAAHDLLDQAMETMHRPAPINPPRSQLPPLRLQPLRSFEPLRSLDHISRPAGSEADAALLAPIRRTHDVGPAPPAKSIRLPPISSFSSHSSHSSNASSNTITQIAGPSSGGHHHADADETGSSTSSSASSSLGPLHSPPPPSHRSSAASVATSQSTHRTPARSSISSFDTLGSGWAAGGGPSLASSRTSFSSEVTEEWERHSATLGRSLGGMPSRNLSLAGSAPVVPPLPRESGWGVRRRSPDEMQGVSERP